MSSPDHARMDPAPGHEQLSNTQDLIDLEAEENGPATVESIPNDTSMDQGKEDDTVPSQKLQDLNIADSTPGTADTSQLQKPLPSTPPLLPQPVAVAPTLYRDPTPKTPTISRHPSTKAPVVDYNEKDSDYAQDPPNGLASASGRKFGLDNDAEVVPKTDENQMVVQALVQEVVVDEAKKSSKEHLRLSVTGFSMLLFHSPQSPTEVKAEASPNEPRLVTMLSGPCLLIEYGPS